MYPAAGQPDIVRLSQKDDLYLEILTDACHDTVRSLLGPRRALLWSRLVPPYARLLILCLRWHPVPAWCTVEHVSRARNRCDRCWQGNEAAGGAALLRTHNRTRTANAGRGVLRRVASDRSVVRGFKKASVVPRWGTSMMPWVHVPEVGEEYFAAGRVGVEPPVMRRGLLVMLQTLVPYLAERVGSRSNPLQYDSLYAQAPPASAHEAGVLVCACLW